MGEWYYPNGTVVPSSHAGNDFTQEGIPPRLSHWDVVGWILVMCKCSLLQCDTYYHWGAENLCSYS